MALINTCSGLYSNETNVILDQTLKHDQTVEYKEYSSPTTHGPYCQVIATWTHPDRPGQRVQLQLSTDTPERLREFLMALLAEIPPADGIPVPFLALTAGRAHADLKALENE